MFGMNKDLSLHIFKDDEVDDDQLAQSPMPDNGQVDSEDVNDSQDDSDISSAN